MNVVVTVTTASVCPAKIALTVSSLQTLPSLGRVTLPSGGLHSTALAGDGDSDLTCKDLRLGFCCSKQSYDAET